MLSLFPFIYVLNFSIYFWFSKIYSLSGEEKFTSFAKQMIKVTTSITKNNWASKSFMKFAIHRVM